MGAGLAARTRSRVANVRGERELIPAWFLAQWVSRPPPSTTRPSLRRPIFTYSEETRLSCSYVTLGQIRGFCPWQGQFRGQQNHVNTERLPRAQIPWQILRRYQGPIRCATLYA